MIRSYQHTVAGLMALVVVVGLGLAALRNADSHWMMGAYNLAFFALSAATLCGILGKGRIRRYSIGFAVFGFTYMLFTMLPDRQVNIYGLAPQPRPTLVIEKVLSLLQPYLKPMSPSDVEGPFYFDQVGISIGVFVSGFFGAVLSRFIAGNQFQQRPNGEEDQR